MDTIDLSLLRNKVIESMTNILKINKKDSIYNDLKLNDQKLHVNINKSKNKIHLIKKGETINMLSEIYHVSTKSIFAVNHINKKTILQIGQKIIIPKK